MSISEHVQATPPRPSPSSNEARVSTPRKRKSPLMMVIDAIASLRFTVVLFALSVLLVFFGTLAQVNGGIWTIVHNYFRSIFVWIPFSIFTNAFDINVHLPGAFPFPGGWLLGGLLMTNLLAAHVRLIGDGYKKWSSGRLGFPWRLPGILLIHTGLVVMMVGEFITGMYAVEGNMSIDEGKAGDHVVHNRFAEFAVIDSSDKKFDQVVVVPQSILRQQGVIRHKDLPFDILVDRYFVNSDVKKPGKGDTVPPNFVGDYIAVEHAEIAGTSQEQSVDVPSMYVKLLDKKTGKSLGTHMFSAWLNPRPVTVDGKTYDVSLRFKRTYRPFSIYLKDFKFDKWQGTEVPRNFSSDVVVIDPERNVQMPVTIRMNEPLRYRGETFYQASFDKATEKTTVLQVVDNWGWMLPYISCIMVGVGMLIHFSIGIVRFSMKSLSGARSPGPIRPEAFVVPAVVVTLGLLYFGLMFLPHYGNGFFARADVHDGMNLVEFGRIPVVNGGRVMPMDTVARNSLMLISGNTAYYDDGGNRHSAMRWLLDVMTWRIGNDDAAKAKVFRIENDNVLNMLKLKARPGFRYSLEEFRDQIDKVADAAKAAKELQDSGKKLDVHQEKVLELHQKLRTFQHLATFESPFVIPPERANGEWKPLLVAVQEMQAEGVQDGPAREYIEMLAAYAEKDAAKFNREVANYKRDLNRNLAGDVSRSSFERFFDNAAPFYHCLIMYVVVFLLAALSWFGLWSQNLSRAAFALLVLTVIVHTLALIGRMYLLNRPFVFVTNLYSSAVFIGWGCVLLGIVLELVLKRSIGTAAAAITGFLSLLVAQLLAITGGDTLAVMQAVLDTNFWLATHVTTITIGYSATFFAGFLGIIYVFLAVFGRPADRNIFPHLGRAIYGVVCFATLFSFIGTVLGGIWADQSWGRFWGWDPKENGALIIVIWNALILHARWSGMLKHRGVAVAAVGGNIVTSWSWFGVNLLGVGLHSYGFSNATLIMLISFVIFNLGVIALGMLPKQYWLSNSAQPPQSPDDVGGQKLSLDWS